MTTFLLIDDQRSSLRATELALQELYPTAEIFTAMSGPEGLRLGREVSPDIVLLDIVLPGMDGFEVCRHMKADPVLRDTPVAFLTGSQERKEYRLLALEAGGESYLTKPIDMTEFTIMMRILGKIRRANLLRRSEWDKLETLVAERTAALEHELAERRASEERLRKSEQIFESLFKSANAGKSVTMVTGEISVNPAFCDMLGYSADELRGKTWQELTPAEDIEPTTKLLNSLVAGERDSARFEKRFIRKDGSLIWTDIGTVLMRDASGKPLYFITTIVDINERVLASQALTTSEARYRSLIEQASDALFIHGYDGRFTEVNKRACESLGYSREELLKLSVPDIDVDYDIARARAVWDAAEEDEPQTVYGTQIRKDGTTFPVEVRFGKCNINGEILFISLVRDITDRVRIENALRLSESRLVQIAEHSRSMEWEVDPTGLYTHFSQLSGAFIGWTAEELVGKKHFYDLAPEEDRADLMAGAFAVFDRQLSFVEFENRILTKSGDVVWVATNGFPIYDEKGNFIGYRGSDTDITQRKQAETELQRSYDLLRRLTDRVPGVVYQYLLRPDGSSCFPISSRGMWDIYNVTSEDVREDATPVFGRIHPEDYDYIVETIMASARDLTLYHSEFRVILPEGGVQWRMCDAEPERTEDGGTLWHGIITDITKRRAMEEELRAAKERAEVNDRLKSAFLMNMSHEIRTPLNGILGSIELIADPDVTSDDRQQLHDIVIRSGNRLMTTIEDILEISRIESGETKVSCEFVNIGEVYGFLLNFFGSQVAEKGISLRITRCDGPCMDLVYTDKHLFESIMINLLRNAVKFTHQGEIEFGCRGSQHETLFFVRDSGPGIPPDKIHAVFERFVQADTENNRNRRYEGTGLGLSIAKSNVELLGGRIWVDSELGRGSTFWFSIPTNPPDPIQIDTKAQSSPFRNIDNTQPNS